MGAAALALGTNTGFAVAAERPQKLLTVVQNVCGQTRLQQTAGIATTCLYCTLQAPLLEF